MFALVMLALFILIIFGIVKAVQYIMKLSTYGMCQTCDGKGYWYSLRERNTCKQCDGTGKVRQD